MSNSNARASYKLKSGIDKQENPPEPMIASTRYTWADRHGMWRLCLELPGTGGVHAFPQPLCPYSDTSAAMALFMPSGPDIAPP